MDEDGRETGGLEERIARDYSLPIEFDLSETKPDKTVDFGHDGTWVSADPLGRVLQLSAFHPEHGVIVAVPFEQFDGTRFRDPLYVRAYRKKLLDFVQREEPGYGIILGNGPPPRRVEIHVPQPDLAQFNYKLTQDGSQSPLEVSTTLRVLEGKLVQRTQVKNLGQESIAVQGKLSLCVSVNRASYGQLTEGGPLPLPPSENELRHTNKGSSFAVINNPLDARLEGSLYIGGERMSLERLKPESVASGHLSTIIPFDLKVEASSTVVLEATFRLLPGASIEIRPYQQKNTRIPGRIQTPQWREPQSVETYIVRRTLDYIIGNCLMPLDDGICAIVTDHVALPLGWNRDNYWQIRFLHQLGKRIDHLLTPHSKAFYAPIIRNIIYGHLRWVFHRAQRPYGYWHRSYLVTGKPKDGKVFQLDQQLYPLLELCDFYDAYGHQEACGLVREILLENTAVMDILQIMLSKADPLTGLIPTEESPGDDEITYPYHFSSHILLWSTMHRLIKLLERIDGREQGSWEPNHPLPTPPLSPPCSSDPLQQMLFSARLLVASIDRIRHFLVRDDEGNQMFAYVTSGNGEYTLYHDGNDMPTLFLTIGPMSLAAIIDESGYCRSTQEPALTKDTIEHAWRNTMTFAFSPRNASGYCGGGGPDDPDPPPFGGLGSVHSSGAWTLGYFQELVFGRVAGDAAREADAWRRIVGAMQWDGTFAEAVDARTGRCASKAWFSWPGAMIAGALLDKMDGEGRAG